MMDKIRPEDQDLMNLITQQRERIAALLDENAAIKRTFEMQQTRIATLEALVLEYGEEIGRLRREFSQQILRSKP